MNDDVLVRANVTEQVEPEVEELGDRLQRRQRMVQVGTAPNDRAFLGRLQLRLGPVLTWRLAAPPAPPRSQRAHRAAPHRRQPPDATCVAVFRPPRRLPARTSLR